MILIAPHRLRIIGYVAVSLFCWGILNQLLIRPTITKHVLKMKVALKNGWQMRDIWSKLPFVIENHIYVFNVTNPVEIGNGAKPIVKEIGPFVYDVYQEKTQQIDNEEDDTVSYVMKNVYHFNLQKSNGLSDEVEVYFPHTYIMTASRKALILGGLSGASLASRSVDSVLNKPPSLFFKTKVKIPLFDGYVIPCAGMQEYFGKLTCNLLKERYFDFTLRKKGEDMYYTSIFGFMNGTYEKQSRIRINRGIKNIKDLGKVVEIAGMNNLSIWEDDKCNEFAGTDATIFPPNIDTKVHDDINLVITPICRRLRLSYDSQVEYAGLNLVRYTADLGTDGDNVPEDKCYCNTPDTCLKKGMFELHKCTNIPIIMSNPHFYLADPYYLSRVDTLKPDKDKHMTQVDFDPLTGQPVRAHTRAQLNMQLLKIDTFRLMRNYSHAMLPMVWTDEIIILPDYLIAEMRMGHKIIRIMKVLEYTMMIIGLSMCLVVAYLKYKSGKVSELDLKASKTVVVSGANGDASNVNSSKLASRVITAVLPNVD